MKTLIAVVAVMLVAFSFGTVYAIDDQMPMEFGISNIGPVAHDRTDWSAKSADTVVSYTSGDVLLPLGPSNDVGIVLARDAEAAREAVLAAKGTKGAAAGGLGASAAEKTHQLGSNFYQLAY